MEYRIEHDSMGEVQVPADRYWGAQTQRSFQNFPIGTEKIPMEVIRAFAILKKAAAIANNRLGKLNFLTSNSNGVIIVSDRVIKHARVNHTLE